MKRRWLLKAVLRTGLIVPLAFASTHSWSASPTALESQSSAMSIIKQKLVDATGYAASDFDLLLQANQFMIAISNSALNDSSSSAREAEASRIVSVITAAIVDRPEFEGILGVHVDYVTRAAGISHTDLVDAIDFRKDPSGTFVHYIT